MSNLPPGVRPSDLPGNRPEDMAWEAQLDLFIDWFAGTGLEVHQAMEAIIAWARAHSWPLGSDALDLLDRLRGEQDGDP